MTSADPPIGRAARLRAALAATGRWLRAFALKHWLPLCFLVATLIALTAPAPGRAVASVMVSGHGARPAATARANVPPSCFISLPQLPPTACRSLATCTSSPQSISSSSSSSPVSIAGVDSRRPSPAPQVPPAMVPDHSHDKVTALRAHPSCQVWC